MKTLDDAVIELNGVWPSKSDLRVYMVEYVSPKVWSAGSQVANWLFTKEQFTQRAKELGFINGYRWGVEYPTNGVQPDLPSDVIIRLFVSMCRGALSVFAGAAMYSAKGASFIIIDERYKPQDTSYLDKPDLIGIDMASGKDESVDHVVHTKTTDTTIEFETVKVDDEFAFTAQYDSDWFDWQNDKMLRLPPVGERVSYSCVERDSKEAIEVGQWYCGTIIAYHCGYVWTSDNGIRALSNTRFRPLDHAARKAELEKKRVVGAAIIAGSTASHEAAQSRKQFVEMLYDKGYLRLPTEKN